jgi:transcriptional regulator with XRE-family HTH domain
MIQGGDDLKRAREQLGWTLFVMARALRLGGDREQSSKRVREMENGARPVSGPVAVAVEGFLEGHRPEGFDPAD